MSNAAQSSICRSPRCGATVFWRETKAGKLAPFDPPEDCPACGGDGCAKCDQTGTKWTSHFATCPDAPQFRRKS